MQKEPIVNHPKWCVPKARKCPVGRRRPGICWAHPDGVDFPPNPIEDLQDSGLPKIFYFYRCHLRWTSHQNADIPKRVQVLKTKYFIIF